MRTLNVWGPSRTSLLAICGMITMSASAADDPSAPADEKQPLGPMTFSFGEARFGEETSSFSHDGLRLAVAPVWADPATGRSSYLLRWTRGTDFRHKHTFSYQVVVLRGVMTHWTQNLPGAEKKQLRAGSLWYAPANEVHVDRCITDECVTLSTTFEEGQTITVGDGR